jgi:uncharacterized protein (TIGR03118 family)
MAPSYFDRVFLEDFGMTRKRPGLAHLSSALALALLAAPSIGKATTLFAVTNLVSDGTSPAVSVDANLQNPIGIAASPTSPFWVANNGTSTSTLYGGAGNIVPLVVSTPSAPTGVVFNSSASAFTIGGTKPAFLFASDTGQIMGWAPTFGTVAAVGATVAGADFKGLGLGTVGADSYLYATDFKGGTLDVFKNTLATFTTTSVDPTMPAGYSPFNATVLGGKLYVTYALQDAGGHNPVTGLGNGFVDVFNLDGTFAQRLVSQGEIDTPWGLALAPSSFGEFAGDLLVGNYGDGTISAFDDVTGAFQGRLLGLDSQPLTLGNLWGLMAGNNGVGNSPQDIYFTASFPSPDGASDGLFGRISAVSTTPDGVPEPTAWALMLLGFGLTGAALRAGRTPRQVRRTA